MPALCGDPDARTLAGMTIQCIVISMPDFTSLLALFMILPMTTHAQSLEELRWQNRVLLVFNGDESVQDKVEAQAKIVVDHADGFAERDLIVRGITPAPDTMARYMQFDVEPHQFIVILIGKDGGEKGRWDKPVAAEELFALIDAMPMRQREMQDAQ
ncbi:MAG: DUF4174 domain-containing protein [Pseudomonadota bacterium]